MMSQVVKRYVVNALMGLSMGVVLANVGFADYDELHRMFTFTDLRMLISFILAITIAAPLFYIFKKYLPGQKKILHPGIIPGSILFGIGWAVCGACPAIVFVQLGMGKLPAIMTLLGIFLGVKLYRYAHARYFKWDTGSCSM